ncbi:oxidoreductase of aldo/keto reductase family, subgroup 1 [Serinicoccus hydrothermalis]|uniref:Oxidoreductase of aldo/keto reductase family, subgroup 1 n=1 Tax=Serinicoccus hydrothermalis TaxID=1758689 RepID=A0A1B1N8K2_9MICO|nr:aldo/keto reductase [Serinicoccus hydrothermalis]ANS77760.1 oxidoreductase of aldo/keto reductase family, subgroup 1 [Serinicoccus hydrothermalis]
MHTLRDGTPLPHVGFGTYPLRDEEGIEAMVSALEVGYRYLDTAVNYENEREVGEALRRSGLPREDVLVATKIPGRAHQRDAAIASVEQSLERLGLDQVDVALVHWPNPSQGHYVEAVEALLECRERGFVRFVGTSNYTEGHLREVLDATGEAPVLNQIECHPLFPQEEMLAVHEELGVLTQAWSPLGKREAQYDAAPVSDAAQRLGVSPAQVILRWHLERGVMPLPKSATPSRQAANLDVVGMELTPEEVAAITALGRPDGRLFGGDPETHEEM